jgi:hypothetical protein
MTVKWTLVGAGWSQSISLDRDTDPVEVATRCIELKLLEEVDTNLGIILELFNSEMASESEHLILLTATVLANAGLYSLASEIEEELDMLLNRHNPENQ